jgi:putative heme-binding domain-containing protein
MDVIPLVSALAHDPSPQVRRECAIALHYNRSAKMPALWAELASQHDGHDRWYLEALGIGAADRDAECLDAYLAKVGDTWNTTPGHDIIWRSRAPKAATYLAKIILDPATGDDERPRYIRALDFIPMCDAKLDALLAMLNSTLPDKSIQLEAVGRLQGVKSPKVPPLEPIVAKVLDEKRGTPEFVELCDQTDVRTRDGELLAYAAAHNGETAGVQAARIVMRHNDKKAIKAALTGPDAVNVVTAFGNIPDGSARPLLAGVVADKTNPLPVRSTAVKTLARSHTGGHMLVELARRHALAEDLAILLGTELRASNSKDIREEADKLFPAPAGKDAKPLPPVSELVKMKGDAAHGHAIWVDTCSKCHQVGSEGVDFGPNLSEIGSKLPKEGLCESILTPSAAIEFGYEGHVVKLKNGDEVEGLIPSQTADEVTVKTAGVGGAILTKYKRADIAQIRNSKLSIMPEGLQTNMSAQDFADLLEYLASLKKK